MIKYKGYKNWFITKIMIPENKLENAQKYINAEIFKKFKELISKEVEILNFELVKTFSQGIKIIYEYNVIIGYKEFENEE